MIFYFIFKSLSPRKEISKVSFAFAFQNVKEYVFEHFFILNSIKTSKKIVSFSLSSAI